MSAESLLEWAMKTASFPVAKRNSCLFSYTFLLAKQHLANLEKAPGTDDLVMGLALNYSTEQIKPFVISLRQHHAGPILLFTNRTQDLQDLAQTWGVMLVDTTQIPAPPSHLVFQRYVFYYLTLLELWPKVGRVFLTDVGDVVFQGSPFAMEFEKDLYYFSEHEGRKISDEPSNWEWMMRAYGPEVTEMLAQAPIINGGTILGTSAAILQYLRYQLTLIDQLPEEAIQFFGTDQATHLYISLFDLIPRAAIMQNYQQVATLGLTPRDWIQLTATGELLVSGKISPVVHQYNYHPDLIPRVLERIQRLEQGLLSSEVPHASI